ncbi:MAG TPA: phenylacetate--CoA ligase family protein [bacterium]|nr:phenylacetate--CoA ligase family protein [bacterium]
MTAAPDPERSPTRAGSRVDDPALFVDPTLESMAREDLRAYQWQRLGPMLTRVGDSNPFYRGKWAAAGVPDVRAIRDWDGFRRLPLTGKAELSRDQDEHPVFGTNLTYPLGRYVRLHQTSGTTGRPMRWLDTVESWEWWIRCWSFVYRAAGVGAGDRVFFAFSFGPFIGFWAGFDAARRIGALAIPGGGLDTALRIRMLVETQTTTLVCTPSYALRLAEVARERGIDTASLGIRVTIHAGEPGASIPATKRRIEAAWGGRCIDHTGMTEVGATGFTCAAGEVHLNESEFVVEVLDAATGTSAAAGEGELVVTNLGRDGSPAIRYRSGDRVRLIQERCACGRTFARLAGGILGRVDDMLVVRGMNVFPSVIEDVVRRFDAVDEFRVEVRRRAEMTELRVVIEVDEPRWGAARVGQTLDALREQLQLACGIRIETAAVGAGALPRFQLKAKRVVHVD